MAANECRLGSCCTGQFSAVQVFHPFFNDWIRITFGVIGTGYFRFDTGTLAHRPVRGKSPIPILKL